MSSLIYLEPRDNPEYFFRQLIHDINTNFSAGTSGGGSPIQNGLNTYTGGTVSAQTINVSALTVNSIYVSGNSLFDSITATTFYSGNTSLQSILNSISSGSSPDLQQVTNNGNTTTNSVIIDKPGYGGQLQLNNTTDQNGYIGIDFNGDLGLVGQFISSNSNFSNQAFKPGTTSFANYYNGISLVAGAIDGTIEMYANGYAITDLVLTINKTGATYYSDFSPFYVDRSLIDKGYLDIRLSGFSSGFSGWTASSGSNSIIANNGTGNVASGQFSFVGGAANSATTIYSTIAGGNVNTSTGFASFIGGGANNKANGSYSSIVGGYQNRTEGPYSFLGGGSNNYILNPKAVIVGGSNNYSYGNHSVITCGYKNKVGSTYGFIGSGYENLAAGGGSTIIISGFKNSATTKYAVVIGGRNNKASGYYSFIGNGKFNIASDYYSIVGGGYRNAAIGSRSFVGAGRQNSATTDYSVVVGGRLNKATGFYSSILGGLLNTTSGISSSILAGTGHTVTGRNSAIIGGGSISGVSDDTVYMPNARLAETVGSVIYSAGTDLYQIFGTGVGGNFLSIGGGTVTGNTMFTTGVTASTFSSSLVSNTRIRKRFVSVASSATPTVNTDNGDVFSLTGLSVNITNASTNLTGTPTHGDLFSYEITDNGVARTISWGASFSNTGTLSLPTTTVISTLLRCLFQYNSVTTKWEIVAVV